ncbi:MAG: hypothetical protein H0U90_05195 [Actinobacteria bacterium]|nr:hypothetical protein [Actinomycetota bacterium]
MTEYKRAEQERREIRARVVGAELAERRRLERNLHDGAQQHLVTANLILHLAERDLGRDPVAARKALASAREELASGLAEIRQLAQGLDPQALAEQGLAAGWSSGPLFRSSSRSSRPSGSRRAPRRSRTT